MQTRQLQVRKDDLSSQRVVASGDLEISTGEILVAVERFALTANNITYGVAGERIGYWNFFIPVDNDDGGWGIIPVWGFGRVIASRSPDIAEGERLYGYFPMGTHLAMVPGHTDERRLIDTAPHRGELPPVYNSYVRLANEPGYDPGSDDERMLLHPLYATAFCLHDFFADNEWFGAEQVVITSASSKTSVGTAYAFHDDTTAPATLGLTSAGNLEKVRAVDLYDTVLTYDNLADIDAGKPTAIIDMSGSGPVLAALHRHLGDNMRYCSNVGLTHWADNAMQDGFIRERSAMFFAPGHIHKRSKDWGPGVFADKARDFWRSAAERSRNWLAIEHHTGLEGALEVFEPLRKGEIGPERGIVIELS